MSQLSAHWLLSGQEYQHLLKINLNEMLVDFQSKCGSPIIRTVFRVDTFVVDMIKHQTVSAAKLLGCGGELAHDVLPAGGGVGEGGMGQGDAVRPDGLSLGALETLDVGLHRGGLALPGEGAGLLLPDAGPLGLVKDQGRGAVIDVRVAMHTVVVP